MDSYLNDIAKTGARCKQYPSFGLQWPGCLYFCFRCMLVGILVPSAPKCHASACTPKYTPSSIHRPDCWLVLPLVPSSSCNNAVVPCAVTLTPINICSNSRFAFVPVLLYQVGKQENYLGPLQSRIFNAKM